MSEFYTSHDIGPKLLALLFVCTYSLKLLASIEYFHSCNQSRYIMFFVLIISCNRSCYTTIHFLIKLIVLWELAFVLWSSEDVLKTVLIVALDLH